MTHSTKDKLPLSRRVLSFTTSALCLIALNAHASNDKVNFTDNFDNANQLNQTHSTKNLKTIAGEIKLDQQVAYRFSEAVLPPNINGATFIEYADINGDNKQDTIILDSYSGNIYQSLQQNNNTFTTTLLFSGNDFCSMAALDIDNDNDIDIVTSSFFSPLSVYKNDGTGSFTEDKQYGSQIDPAVCVEEIINGDFNNDKYADLVLIYHGQHSPPQKSEILLNNQNGGLHPKQVFNDDKSITHFEHAFDLNGDGLQDIWSYDENTSENRIFINKSQGATLKFEEVQGITSSYNLFYAGDFNNDGKNDFLVQDNADLSTRLIIGDNTATPLNSKGVILSGMDQTKLNITDLNNDKKVNEFFTTGNYQGKAYIDYNFVESWQPFKLKTSRKILTSTINATYRDYGITDLNNDGVIDIYTWGSRGAEVFFGGQSSSFTDTEFPSSSRQAKFIDVNQDGVFELFNILGGKHGDIHQSNRASDRLFQGATPSIIWNVKSTQFADINHDGRQEIIAIKDSGQDAIFFANHKGEYLTETLLGTASDAKSRTKKHFIADLNNDGLNDIIAIKDNAESLIYLQKASGEGEFEASTAFIFTQMNTNKLLRSKKIADIALLKQQNEHGLASIAISYYDEEDKANKFSFLSQKAGDVFYEKRQFSSPSSVLLKSLDLNNDGNRDILAGFEAGIAIYYMDTKYNDLALEYIIFGNNKTKVTDLALHDINHDNKLDILVVSNNTDSSIYVYDEQSKEYKLDTKLLPKFKDSAFYIDIQDIDNDGDADLIYDTGKSARGDYSDKAIISTLQGFGGYLTPQTVTSNTINTHDAPLSEIKLSADVTNTTNNLIDYYLSNNNGINWYPVQPEQFFTFPTPGNDLKWKAILRSSVGQTPTLNSITLTGKKAQTIQTDSIPVSTPYGIDIAITASASSGLSVTFKSLTPPVCDFLNGKLTFGDLGKCMLELSQNGNDNYLGIKQYIAIEVVPKPIKLNFTPVINKSYGDGSFNITVNTNDHSAPIEFTSTTPLVCSVKKGTQTVGNNAVASPVTILKPGSCTIVANQQDGGITAPATQPYSFNIAKGTRALNYSNDLIEFRVANKSHTVIAAPILKPLPPKVSIIAKTPDICSARTDNDANVHFNQFKKAGTCEAEVTLAEDTYFVESKKVVRLTIAPTNLDLNQHIETPLDTVFKSGQTRPINLNVGSNAAHPQANIHYNSKTPHICTVKNNQITLVSAGTCIITANLLSQNSYQPVTQDFTFDIAKAAQTITAANISQIPFSTTPITLNVTADSGLPVSFKSNSPANCEIKNNQIVTLNLGKCSIDATQAGNANYLPATKVHIGLDIEQGPQIITFPKIGNHYLSSGSVTLKATTSSNLAVTYTTTSKHCQINGNQVKLLSIGTCQVKASQAGNEKFTAASEVSQSFSILTTPTKPDPEPGLIVVKAIKLTVQEDAPHVAIALTRIGGTYGTIKAHFALQDGTAIANKDYVFKSEKITFSHGESNKTVLVKLIDNDQYQGDRTFSFNLTSGQIGTAKKTMVTILEDDKKPVQGVVKFVKSNITVNEGDNKVSLELVRTGGSDGELIINYASTDGTAKTPHDYQQVASSITFADGETNKSILVTLVDDKQYENDEYFTLSLNQAEQRSRIGSSNIKITITDNDTKPAKSVINFEHANYRVTEDQKQVSIVVKRSINTDDEVRVNVITHDVTALAGNDYQALDTVLIFKQGEVTKTLNIPIIDDALFEREESFEISLVKPQNSLLGAQAKANVAIIDNETPPESGVISFSGLLYEVNESSQTIDIPIVRTDGKNGELSVTVKTIDGTAIKGEDYESQTWLVTFQDQEVSKVITVNVIDDAATESNEYLTLAISTEGNNATLGEITETKLSILDNEPITEVGVIELSKQAYQVDESQETVTIELLRKNGSDGELSVTLTASSGTANADEDFDAIETQVYFADGQKSETVSISIYHDDEYEGDEQFTVKLNGDDSILGQVTQATVQIIEDDARPEAGTLAIDPTSYTFIKGQNQLIFTVNRTGGTYGETSVDYAVQEATNTFNESDALATGSVKFNDGQTVQGVSVTLKKAVDNVTVALSNAVGAELGETPSVTLEAKPKVTPSKGSSGGSMFWFTLLLASLCLMQKHRYRQ